jgi:4-hydroxy-tetrahydrodipicolinate reductase
MTKTNLAIAGASGRMGRMLIECAAQDTDIELVAALDASGSKAIGVSARLFGGNTDVFVTDNADALEAGDVLIDFTRPEGTLAYLQSCVQQGAGIVIGTTGFDAEAKTQIALAAKSIPIVMSPNFSVGVNTLFRLLELAAKSLHSGYDIEILEMHHRMKVDAPSGTAIKLGEVIAQAQGTKLEDRAEYSRVGHTGERRVGTIGFATMRGGDVVGDHTVIFAGAGERIEIAHKSSSRIAYATGAIKAAKFLRGRSSGLYDMFDVLGLRAT